MKKKTVGWFTVGVLFIMTGALYFINELYPISMFKSSKFLFAIGLILLGAEYLILNILNEKNEKQYELRLSMKPLILIVFIFFINMVIFNFNSFSKNIVLFDGVGVFSSTYTLDNEYRIDKINDYKRFIINNPYGSVDIKNTDVEEILVTSKIIIKSNEEQRAKNIAEKLIEVKKKSSLVELISYADKYRDNSMNITVDFVIEAPKQLEVDIDNGYGDIVANDIEKNINIKNKHGKIYIDNANKAVKIRNSYDDIELKNIIGLVEIEQKHGNVKGEYVKNGIVVNAEYCKVDLSNIEGKTDIKTTHDDIELRNLQNELKISLEYGDIDIQEVQKDIGIKSKHTNILIENKDNEIKNTKIENEYGDININVPDKQPIKYNLHTTYGDIDTNFDLSIDDKNNEAKADGILNNGENNLQIENRHGAIRFKHF